MMEHTTYAGFGKRLGAHLIDLFVLLIIDTIVFVAFSAFQDQGSSESADSLAKLVILATTWLYFAIMECSQTQGTIGKVATGIIVTDCNGDKISFAQASGRFFGKLLSSIMLCFGYLMILFTERKQGLHDKLAGTLVLNKVPNENVTQNNIDDDTPPRPDVQIEDEEHTDQSQPNNTADDGDGVSQDIPHDKEQRAIAWCAVLLATEFPEYEDRILSCSLETSGSVFLTKSQRFLREFGVDKAMDKYKLSLQGIPVDATGSHNQTQSFIDAIGRLDSHALSTSPVLQSLQQLLKE